jgi:16S rRNA (uracil1498-N3)-methyltransferase
VHTQNKIRIFVDTELGIGKIFRTNEDQSHYLLDVMRIGEGESIYCLDGASGEYACEIKLAGKKFCELEVIDKVRGFKPSPDIWMLFSPIKKDNTDLIIQKSTELGVRRIVPTISLRTISEKIRKDRFVAQSIEAAEQCRRLDLPQISDAVTLTKLLQEWSGSRILFFMDESGNGKDINAAFGDPELAGKPAAILVGPEGGFSQDEFSLLRRQSFARAVTLGKRILRAETAAIAALSCWQAILGDWKDGLG